MGIMLGNMSVQEIEERAGVQFPEELKTYMAERQQQRASNVEPGKWHCFDIPFVLVCGDMEVATYIHNHLKHLSSQFKVRMDIGVSE